jgi:hypothetical protein
MATGAVRYRDSWRTKALRGLRLFWTLFPNTARAPAPALSLSLYRLAYLACCFCASAMAAILALVCKVHAHNKHSE